MKGVYDTFRTCEEDNHEIFDTRPPPPHVICTFSRLAAPYLLGGTYLFPSANGM